MILEHVVCVELTHDRGKQKQKWADKKKYVDLHFADT